MGKNLKEVENESCTCLGEKVVQVDSGAGANVLRQECLSNCMELSSKSCFPNFPAALWEHELLLASLRPTT